MVSMMNESLNTNQNTLFVIDDDEGVRECLVGVAKLMQMKYASYPSAQDFLDDYNDRLNGCLLIDVKMPGMSGLDLQRRLNKKGCKMPVIMMSAYSNVRVAVESLQNGAITFLQKPFRLNRLQNHVEYSLCHDKKTREEIHQRVEARRKLSLLTAEQTKLIELFTEGMPEEQIAAEFGTTVDKVTEDWTEILSILEVQNLPALWDLLDLGQIGTS